VWACRGSRGQLMCLLLSCMLHAAALQAACHAGIACLPAGRAGSRQECQRRQAAPRGPPRQAALPCRWKTLQGMVDRQQCSTARSTPRRLRTQDARTCHLEWWPTNRPRPGLVRCAIIWHAPIASLERVERAPWRGRGDGRALRPQPSWNAVWAACMVPADEIVKAMSHGRVLPAWVAKLRRCSTTPIISCPCGPVATLY
jgi:hypothetical protein